MNKSAIAESSLMPIRVPTTVDKTIAETDIDVFKKNSYNYYHPFHRISSKCFSTHTISVKIKQKIIEIKLWVNLTESLEDSKSVCITPNKYRNTL